MIGGCWLYPRPIPVERALEHYVRRKSAYFEERYPRWVCPDCGQTNRFLDTFFETCRSCGADHTLDWDQHREVGGIDP
jgi:predicted RNA-binding Zn-ribbon protein involved in translation (DUF1610 family)